MGRSQRINGIGNSNKWSSRCVLCITVTVFLTVQVGLCVFYLTQTRVCDDADGRTTLINVEQSWLNHPSSHHALQDLKGKPFIEPRTREEFETAAENNEDENMLKTWMNNNDDNAKAEGNDGNGNKDGNQPFEASHLKIDQRPIDNNKDVSLQFKKIPVVDFKTLKNQTKGSLGLLLKSLQGRLKNDVAKMLPKPGQVFHERRRNFTIVTSTNAAFLDFTENWLLSLKRIGVKHSISIIAEDAVAYKYLTTKYNGGNIHIFATSNNDSTTKALQFLSAEYTSLVNRRAEYMLHFLQNDVDVLAVDVDAYWFRDPMEVIQGGFDVYDVWVSVGADEKRACPCFMYLKSKPNVIQMVKDWSNRMQRLEGQENDQEALGQILWKYKMIPLNKGLRVNAARLDKDLFPTGKVFFSPSWWWEHGKRVYVAHANRIGNHDKKVAFFREYNLWLIEPYNVDLTGYLPDGQPEAEQEGCC